MKKSRMVNSQISNWKTYKMYKNQMVTLAKNVFRIKNLPLNVDLAYIETTLLMKGSIAFFYDEIMGLVALPYQILGTRDIYDRPINIQVIGNNSYSKVLKKGEYVIMYDNNGYYPIYLDILQYAERISEHQRTMDINISQMKTPRFFKTNSNKEKSIKDLVNNIDSNANVVVTYEDIDLDDTTVVLSPAPYVADKIDIQKNNIWNEFLRFIGISNLSYIKKERNIKDEIQAMQGGTIASRFSRFEPRQRAIEEINLIFKDKLEKPLSLEYYDGEPSTEDEMKGDEENVESNI